MCCMIMFGTFDYNMIEEGLICSRDSISSRLCSQDPEQSFLNITLEVEGQWEDWLEKKKKKRVTRASHID